MTRLLLPALGLLALTACSSTPKDETPPTNPGGDESPAEAKPKDTTELGHKLDYATRELAIAQLGANARKAKAQRDVEEAAQKLADATEELETYKGMEVVREKEAAKLQVDRSQHSLIIAQQSAEALRIQFAQEEEAMSEDPVLQKTERELGFAERNFAQAERARALKDLEISRKERRLSLAKDAAAAAHESSLVELERTLLSIELELLRKRHGVEAAEKALTEAGGTAEAE